MAASKSIAKKPLGSVTMHMSHVHGRSLLTKTSVSWKIHNFSMIRDNTHYTSFYEPEGWTFSLHKKRKVLTVTLDTKKERQVVECGVGGSETRGGNFALCEKYDKGIYERKFETQDYAENPFMRKDTLMLAFKFSDLCTSICSTPSKQSRDVSKDIAKDLLHVLSGQVDHALHDNFVIRGKSYGIPVHKSILAARSTYFSKLFEDFPDAVELEVNIEYRILREVITFMYTGEVRLNKMWFRTRSIFELAHNLGVTKLLSTISLHLMQSVDQGNVNGIRELGIKTGLKGLVEAADTFIHRRLHIIYGR